MIMMTAKVNVKKIFIAVLAVAALIIALVSFTKDKQTDPASVTTMSDNDSRVQFLRSLGWEVTTSPKEAGQVKIPKEQTPVYSRYNDLQKSQGYDLTEYAGKTVMRYVYEVNNFPDAQQPVYATVLVYKNKIIGGDITDTSAKGAMQALKKPAQTEPSSMPPASTTPTLPSAPAE